MVFQRLALFPHLTVAENVAFPLRMRRFDARTIPQRVERYLDLVRLPGFGGRRIQQLSGGQQQRVLLARALAAEPDVLVLDEPTAGMDLASESAILAFLRELNRTRRVTILMVTHHLSLVLNFATTVLLIDGGEMLYGGMDDVLREDRLSALYGVPVHLGSVGGQRTLTVGQRGPEHV
jgi:putative spermidine/putrescine transport system ATP-binding protein